MGGGRGMGGSARSRRARRQKKEINGRWRRPLSRPQTAATPTPTHPTPFSLSQGVRQVPAREAEDDQRGRPPLGAVHSRLRVLRRPPESVPRQIPGRGEGVRGGWARGRGGWGRGRGRRVRGGPRPARVGRAAACVCVCMIGRACERRRGGGGGREGSEACARRAALPCPARLTARSPPYTHSTHHPSLSGNRLGGSRGPAPPFFALSSSSHPRIVLALRFN